MLTRKITGILLGNKLCELIFGQLRNAIMSEFNMLEFTHYKIIKNKDLIESQCANKWTMKY